MKRLVFLAVVGVLLSTLAYGVANRVTYAYSHHRDTMTVDNQWSDTTWDSGGSLIITSMDSANAVLCLTGSVYLAPHDRLYMGFGDDTAYNRPNLCTLEIKPDVATRNPAYHTFVLRDLKKMKNGGQTDTVSFWMATGSSASKVKIGDLLFTVEIQDSIG